MSAALGFDGADDAAEDSDAGDSGDSGTAVAETSGVTTLEGDAEGVVAPSDDAALEQAVARSAVPARARAKTGRDSIPRR
jgi:hypothetical protein